MSRIYTALQQRPLGKGAAHSPDEPAAEPRAPLTAQATPVAGTRLRVMPAAPDAGSVLSAMQASGRCWSPVAAHHVPGAVEQYRRLAAQLVRVQAEHGVKVVMIASAGPGEGKSVTAANLGLTLAKSYRRSVLLVDADLRLPTLHEIFRLPNDGGLSDLLAAGSSHRLAPVEVFPSLALLPAGRPTPDPMGILASPQMQRLLHDAAARFDWVIVDTPPVTVLPDAGVLGAMVDAVVLVLAAGATQYGAAHRAVETLGRERVLGAVLNRATEGLEEKGYQHYYKP